MQHFTDTKCESMYTSRLIHMDPLELQRLNVLLGLDQEINDLTVS